jgi:hypothetical protein
MTKSEKLIAQELVQKLAPRIKTELVEAFKTVNPEATEKQVHDFITHAPYQLYLLISPWGIEQTQKKQAQQREKLQAQLSQLQ